MKKQSYIVKIGVALTLLLFSVATRSNMFAFERSATPTYERISNDNSSGILISLDKANHVYLICADDTSDDDHHVFLSSQIKNRIRGLCCENYFYNCLSSSAFTSFFFSSDTSPPLV